jgi:hypothetical protein
MKLLTQYGAYFQRGDRTFECWRVIDQENGLGQWMLAFYECAGFLVSHANGPELDGLIAGTGIRHFGL